MSQIHKTDDYNFAQPSRTGRAGFESFKDDADGRFYFHFNDAKGVAFLFSQAYQRDITRDKGIQSVIKNAASDEQFERQNIEGGFCFIIRAGNKQEIARSHVFKSLVELVQKQTFLRQNLSLMAIQETSKATTVSVDKPTVKEATAQPTSGISPAFLKAENEDLKEKVAALETQLAGLQSVALETKDLSDETLRHVFRIEIYKNNSPERLYGKIIHPFSDQTQTFTGFDSQTILAFMTTKVQADLPITATTLTTPQPTTPQYQKAAVPKPSLERSPVKAINLNNSSNLLQQNQPFALMLNALPNERNGIQAGQTCDVEITAFNLDTREKFKLLEKRTTIQSDSNKYDLNVRIEPLVLNMGSYRLSFVAHIAPHKATVETKTKWQGSIILQVY
jgi:uncharacterized protein